MLKEVKKSRVIFLVIFIIIMILSAIYGMRYMNITAIIKKVQSLPLAIKYIAMIGLIALQTVLAFLPGEPFELASGYIFGAWQGTVICMLGSFIGTILVYFIVHIFRESVINVMFNSKKLEEIKGFFAKKKSMFWTFILFLIPGTPKDIMTYVVSLGNINLIYWLTLTTIGRIPSIVTSTFLSGYVKEGNTAGALIILILTIALVIVGSLLYKVIISTDEKKKVLNKQLL